MDSSEIIGQVPVSNWFVGDIVESRAWRFKRGIVFCRSCFGIKKGAEDRIHLIQTRKPTCGG